MANHPLNSNPARIAFRSLSTSRSLQSVKRLCAGGSGQLNSLATLGNCMDTFIALCENPQCCAVFSVPGIIGGPGNVTVHMTNTHAGPCPACGSHGQIPDGIYNYSNQLIKFINGPKESIEKLKMIES